MREREREGKERERKERERKERENVCEPGSSSHHFFPEKKAGGVSQEQRFKVSD